MQRIAGEEGYFESDIVMADYFCALHYRGNCDDGTYNDLVCGRFTDRISGGGGKRICMASDSFVFGSFVRITVFYKTDCRKIL